MTDLPSDGRPPRAERDYDATERTADAVIHGIGVAFAIVGATVLVAMVLRRAGRAELMAAMVYAACLLLALGASAAYNVWPVTRMKWLLRRFDHSAIYALIAGTYTPFLTLMKGSVTSTGLMIGIWVTAAAGAAVKLLLPGRFDRISVGLYLILGWSGVMAYQTVVETLPGAALLLIAIGGLLYTAGVIFHAWRTLRFQNAIWHAFVLVAAACHYGAVLDCLVLARPPVG